VQRIGRIFDYDKPRGGEAAPPSTSRPSHASRVGPAAASKSGKDAGRAGRGARLCRRYADSDEAHQRLDAPRPAHLGLLRAVATRQSQRPRRPRRPRRILPFLHPLTQPTHHTAVTYPAHRARDTARSRPATPSPFSASPPPCRHPQRVPPHHLIAASSHPCSCCALVYSKCAPVQCFHLLAVSPSACPSLPHLVYSTYSAWYTAPARLPHSTWFTRYTAYTAFPCLQRIPGLPRAPGCTPPTARPPLPSWPAPRPHPRLSLTPRGAVTRTTQIGTRSLSAAARTSLLRYGRGQQLLPATGPGVACPAHHARQRRSLCLCVARARPAQKVGPARVGRARLTGRASRCVPQGRHTARGAGARPELTESTRHEDLGMAQETRTEGDSESRRLG
jgi:hypothetical protein